MSGPTMARGKCQSAGVVNAAAAMPMQVAAAGQRGKVGGQVGTACTCRLGRGSGIPITAGLASQGGL